MLPVSEIIIRDGEAKAIRLEDNTEINARKAVVTTLEPKQTFLRLVDKAHLEKDFVNMVENFTFGDVASFRVHFALHEAPEFIGDELLSKAPFQRTIVSLQEIDRHFAKISIGAAPVSPPVHCHCWTLRDPTRAPEGKHTFMIDTFVPSKLRD